MDDFYFDPNSDYIVDVFKDGYDVAICAQFLEVFAVKVRARNKCEGEVYGSFHIKDGKHTLCYYNRQPEDCQPIDKDRDCSLLLSGPHRPVSVTRRIKFSLDLKDKNGDELIRSIFLLRLMDNEEDEGKIDDLFDRYQFLKVIGRSANATIYYTLPRVASLARLELKLVDESGANGSGDGRVDVYGNIVAHYGNSYDTSVTEDDVRKHFSFNLFKQEEDKKVQVKYGEFIPLLRSRVVFPHSTSIVIELNLELIHSDGFKDQIKNDEVNFRYKGWFEASHIFKLNHGGSMVLRIVWRDTFL